MKRIFLISLLALAVTIPTFASMPWVPIVQKPPYKDPGGDRPKDPAEHNLFGCLNGTDVTLHFENPEGDASVTVTALPSGEVIGTEWDTTRDLKTKHLNLKK